jgi:hypothetical protein
MKSLRTVKRIAAEESVYLEKLQRNRKKAAKAKKPYWQARIDAFFMEGVVK